jgi:hypothetical protein
MAVTQFACISVNSALFIRRRPSFDRLIPLSALAGPNVEPSGLLEHFQREGFTLCE